jgi:hypothetical protein
MAAEIIHTVDFYLLFAAILLNLLFFAALFLLGKRQRRSAARDAHHERDVEKGS